MTTITFSPHAHFRINSRLGNLTNCLEVFTKINRVANRLTDNRNWVMIKKINYIEIADPDVKPDGVARGDMVVALVENGVIETVLIRKSWSKSPEFKKIIH